MNRIAVTLTCVILQLCAPACERDRPQPAPAVAMKPAAERPAPKPKPKPKFWPEPGSPLKPPALSFPEGFGQPRVFLDAGHGNAGNAGAESCLCEDEQDINLALVKHMAPILKDTQHFHLKLSRDATSVSGDLGRLADAAKFHAGAIVSIHADVRGEGRRWSPSANKTCWRNDSAPGFSVLFADAGPRDLVDARRRLARTIASALLKTGFLPYGGEDYEDLYEGDAQQPGVFMDRHVPGERILFLRGTRIPSVIIETHHAWDLRETKRFAQPATRDAFAQAVAAGLQDFFR